MTTTYETYEELMNAIETIENVTAYAKRHSIQNGTEYLECFGNSLLIINFYGDDVNGYKMTVNF